MNTLISTSRKKYHQLLLSDGVLTVDSKGIPSNADSSSKLSVLIAQGIAEQISVNKKSKALGQTSGAKFEQINMEFLKNTFPLLSDLRPGKWHVAIAFENRISRFGHGRHRLCISFCLV